MPTTIGLRDLRQNLRSVMDRVRSGERLIVTDHNKPIAGLVPIDSATVTFDRLVDAGIVRPPTRNLVIEPLDLDGPGLSEALDEIRADRDI